MVRLRSIPVALLVGGGLAWACAGGGGSKGAPPSPPDAGPCAVVAPQSATECSLQEFPDLPGPVFDASAVISKGFAYVLAGAADQSGEHGSSVVWYSQLDANGVPGTWKTTTPLPAPLLSVGLAANNGFLYAVGGDNTAASTIVATVNVATQNADGTLGAWTATTSLPSARAGNAVVVLNNYLYSLGGAGTENQGSGAPDLDSDPNAPVYDAPFHADGTLGAWKTNSASLPPSGRESFGAVAMGGRIYAVGGRYSSSEGMCEPSKVLIGGQNTDGSIAEWDPGTEFADDVQNPGVQLVGNALIVLGGLTSGMYPLNAIYSAPISTTDGSIGAWSQIGQWSQSGYSARATAATATAVYAFGGYLQSPGGTGTGAPIASTTMALVSNGALTCPMPPAP